jgi:hypothetical protein
MRAGKNVVAKLPKGLSTLKKITQYRVLHRRKRKTI